MSALCRRIVTSRWFDPLILGVIFVNAVTLGLETYDSVATSVGDRLHLLNDLTLVVFCVEHVIRFGAEDFNPLRFFRSG